MDILTLAAALKKANAYTDTKISEIGKGMEYKGSVDTKNDLPLSNNKLGYVYTVSGENGQEYVWIKNAASGALTDWEMLGGSGITYEEV